MEPTNKEMNVVVRPSPDLYLKCFAALLIPILLGPVWLMRTHVYALLSADFMNPKIDYAYILKSQKYDVVIYGDSSAMFGINPEIVSKRTGFSVLNLSQTIGVVKVERERPLDSYLAANGKPKLLVLALNPENVSVDQDGAEKRAIDGWYAVVRQNSFKYAVGKFWQHPRMLFVLWSNTVQEEFSSGFGKGHFRKYWEELKARDGYYDYPRNRPLGSCAEIPAHDPDRLRQHSYVNYFRKKYTDAGYEVAVFLTPVADCDPNLPMIKETLGSLAVNSPFTLPRSFVADDDQKNHPLPSGTVLVSNAFSVLLEKERQHLHTPFAASLSNSPSLVLKDGARSQTEP